MIDHIGVHLIQALAMCFSGKGLCMLNLTITEKSVTIGFFRSILLMALILNTMQVNAQQSTIEQGYLLHTNPTRCVALRQGQTCYQEIQIKWQAPETGHYCLVNLTTSMVSQCWKNQQQGSITLDFKAMKSNQIALRKYASDQDLANASITVAWVFSSSKRNKSNWKLF